METSLPAHTMTNWVGWLSVHQDVFWFAALLAWSLVLVLWWRHPERGTEWAWVPAAAGAGIASAWIQFGIFNPTLDAFQARLIPGSVAHYRPARIDPYWLGDVLLGATLAAMAAAWAWQAAAHAGRRVGKGGAVLAAGLVAAGQVAWPDWGGSLLALWATGAFAWLARRLKLTGASLAWGALALGLVFASTVGPVAAWTDTLQRSGPPTPMGLLAGAVTMLVGGGVGGALAVTAWRRLETTARATLWADVRWPLAAAVVLLGLGVGFGVVTARDNRMEILENRLRTTAAHAAVFDPNLLGPLGTEAFWRAQTRAEGRELPEGGRAPDAAGPARQRLVEEVIATPFVQQARIVVLRDGWLIAALTSEPGVGVEYLRRATPEDLRRWANPEPYVEESPIPEIGYNYYTRAPILSADGRMLGWLEAVRDEFYLTVPRRWRTGPFLITALGVVLLAFVSAQRRSAREREAALRAAAVAAEANRITTAFFANVSHELRTPLQSILGYSELLQRELPADTPHRLRLAALREQGELMTRLVNDLIDLSAAEAGAFQLAPRPLAPAALVLQTVESFRARSLAKHLDLRCELGSGLPLWVRADAERWRQLVNNLVNNAIKFTDRGSVHVRLEARALGGERHEFTLTVRDTGPGIPPAQQARLFMPFTRLAQTAAKEGAGLGLALSAALCRAMEGSLRVESDGLTGSTFVATFAAEQVPAPAAVAAPTAAGAGDSARGRRVLIVDDNTLVRELFAGFLQSQGATCGTAATGAEALAQVTASSWEVILLDLALPDGSGADWVTRLRAQALGVRIIGVSAHAGLAERENALAAGMDAFLVKPVALDELWRALARPAAGGPPVAPASALPALAAPGAVSASLLAAFARELPGKRAELAAAVAAREWPRVRSVAHYLRNSALVVQAGALFDACTGLENAATVGDAEAVAAWWPRCERALDEVTDIAPAPVTRP